MYRMSYFAVFILRRNKVVFNNHQHNYV